MSSQLQDSGPQLRAIDDVRTVDAWHSAQGLAARATSARFRAAGLAMLGQRPSEGDLEVLAADAALLVGRALGVRCAAQALRRQA